MLLDISTSGGGLRTLFNLAVVLELADSRCLLLDEPDAHLHGTLQRVISLMLADHSDEFDTQVIVASHAPDFLAEAPLECLRWVDRRAEAARPCDGLGEVLTNLGAISNADAIRVSGADKVLFVEGGFDHSLMSALFEKSGKANPFSDSTIIVARLPSGKGSVTHLQAFRHLLRETFHLHIKVAVVTDRDYQLDQEEPAHTEVLVATLERKEAENYLLNPSVIAGAMKSVAKKRFAKTREPINAPDEGEVASKLDEIVLTSSVRDTLKFQVLPRYRETLDAGFDQSTKEKLGDEWWSKQWSDSTWRINMCPGKKVLAEMRKWSQSTFGITLTRGELMSAVTDCPEEIAKIAENIERHFSGK